MTDQDRWLLPAGIEEAMPVQAEWLETHRRRILDLYHSWGYELVMPPFVEYLESLLTGTGHEMDLQTFKLTDQLTGRLMGVRADMTPQVARIDAHRLKGQGPTRLCYMGTVLHTRPDGFAGSRSLLQVGAELFGHAGVDSDLEVVRLMLETLRACGLWPIHLDLGHVGMFRALAAQAGLDDEAEGELFERLQRKALPEIDDFLERRRLQEPHREMLLRLGELHGGTEVIDEARQVFAEAGTEVAQALNYLQEVAAALQQLYPDVELHFDLAELRGYHYHTGLVFAAYIPGRGQEIARGGRYDDIGRVFGRARPATGFSTDLKSLMALGQRKADGGTEAVFAPSDDDAALHERVEALRASGERVVRGLRGQTADARAMGCRRQLVRQGDRWVISEVD